MEDRELKTVYFIRHNNLGGSIAKDLYKANRIGVYYANVGKANSFKADSYSNAAIHKLKEVSDEDILGYNTEYKGSAAQKAITYLDEMTPDSIVVASFKIENEIKILIGNPGTKDVKDMKSDNDFDCEIKYIQLENTEKHTVSIDTFPHPFLVPPLSSTICIWKAGKVVVNAYISRNYPQLQEKDWVDLLLPQQQEIICEEWLRINKDLKYKLFKTGVTLKDFDIVGLNSEGKYILAQVKYSCSYNEIRKFKETVERFASEKPDRIATAMFFLHKLTKGDESEMMTDEILKTKFLTLFKDTNVETTCFNHVKESLMSLTDGERYLWKLTWLNN